MVDHDDAATFPTPGMPEGRELVLPGRGSTFVREVPGPPGAQTVLLLHGWTVDSALNYFAAYPALGERFRVVALDHRGHGRGIRNGRRFTLEDCADDAAALLDELGIERAIAVGYSMGGPVAQLLWQRHRPRVEGLVLCATAARFRDGRGGLALKGVATGLSLATRAAPGWVHRRVTDRVLVARYDSSPLGRWARERSRQNDLRSMIDAGHALGAYDASGWIGGVDVPTSVVLTRYDTTVPPERQEQLAHAVRGTRVVAVSGGHDVCAVDPDEFVPALVEACVDVDRRAALRPHRSGDPQVG